MQKESAPQDLFPVYDAMHTVHIMIDGLSDADLYDLCIFDIEMYKRKDLDDLYEKLALGESLTPEERKKVEAFYMLTNVVFLVNE